MIERKESINCVHHSSIDSPITNSKLLAPTSLQFLEFVLTFTLHFSKSFPRFCLSTHSFSRQQIQVVVEKKEGEIKEEYMERERYFNTYSHCVETLIGKVSSSSFLYYQIKFVKRDHDLFLLHARIS